MAIVKNEVNLMADQLIEDLNNGLTWLKKDDLGYGSIEQKYGPNPQQIAVIRKHPDLKNADTTVTVFNIIGCKSSSKEQNKPAAKVEKVVEPVIELTSSTPNLVEPEAADLFANL
jgi:DNA modification methylase